VRDLVTIAFGHVGLDWEQYVKTDERFMRPAEVEYLLANPAKAKRLLDWEPTMSFEGMVQEMVDADLERIQAKR
jgi:GDPmannose 4,6-dehydratase